MPDVKSKKCYNRQFHY